MSRSLHVVWQNKEFFGEFSKSLPMCNGFFVDNKEEVSLGNWEMLQINCFLIGCFSGCCGYLWRFFNLLLVLLRKKIAQWYVLLCSVQRNKYN